MLVPYVHWIIVEDATENSALVKNLLTAYGFEKRSTLLNAKTPTDFKLKGKVSHLKFFNILCPFNSFSIHIGSQLDETAWRGTTQCWIGMGP